MTKKLEYDILENCLNKKQREMLFIPRGYLDYDYKYNLMFINVDKDGIQCFNDGLLNSLDSRFKNFGETFNKNSFDEKKFELLEVLIFEYIDFIQNLEIKADVVDQKYDFIENPLVLYKKFIKKKYNKFLIKENLLKINPFIKYYCLTYKTITDSYFVSPLNFFFPYFEDKRELLYHGNIIKIIRKIK